MSCPQRDARFYLICLRFVDGLVGTSNAFISLLLTLTLPLAARSPSSSIRCAQDRVFVASYAC